MWNQGWNNENMGYCGCNKCGKQMNTCPDYGCKMDKIVFQPECKCQMKQVPMCDMYKNN